MYILHNRIIAMVVFYKIIKNLLSINVKSALFMKEFAYLQCH